MSELTSSSQVLAHLKSLASPKAVAGMARFGIPVDNALGISTPALQALARTIGRNHSLAEELWKTGIHEARILATLIGEPEKTTERQMERWVRELDAWDVCDACCGKLFDKTTFAYRKAIEWSRRKEEFVKRAGFSLMAALAVHDKQSSDARFLKFLPAIRRESTDERNFVRKAVNWALRQIGKRNIALNRAAIRTARQIQKTNSRAGRWIAADALRELTSKNVQKRLRAKKRH
ncbi:MAG: DNA alkylation repair protein [Candidatus Acidiferrales bacterium]